MYVFAGGNTAVFCETVIQAFCHCSHCCHLIHCIVASSVILHTLAPQVHEAVQANCIVCHAVTSISTSFVTMGSHQDQKEKTGAESTLNS